MNILIIIISLIILTVLIIRCLPKEQNEAVVQWLEAKWDLVGFYYAKGMGYLG